MDWLWGHHHGCPVAGDRIHGALFLEAELLYADRCACLLYTSYAIERMRRVLYEYKITGVKTNLAYLKRSMRAFFSIKRVLYSPFTKSGTCMMRFR